MSTSTRTVSFLRPLLGSVLLLGGVLLLNACGTSGSARDEQTASRTLRLTAVDSMSGEPLDSARAVNRTFGDTLRTDSAGLFEIRNAESALYVFDVGGYGYHTQRHVTALVEPGDSAMSVTSQILPKELTIDCEGSRPYFWDTFVKRYQQDKSTIRFQLTNVFAKEGQVTVQPVVVNDLSSPLLLPNNFGALGHYDITLYAGSTRVPYEYENAPRDEGHRIYEKSDILPVVPKELERLEPNTLILSDSVEEGTTIYARMRYTFTEDDTLRATSATTFPDLNLDSLQTPIFDTLRTDGAVRVPDSLRLQRDTTIMKVIGIDTTVTRNGYTLFSTWRKGNAAPNAKKARNLLYVPDSVLARARRDSLEAIAEAQSKIPDIDTTALAPGEIRSPLQIVERTNTPALRSLFEDERLIQDFSVGLPELKMSADSLLAFSTTLRNAYLQTPSISKGKARQGLDTEPDTALADSLILSAPASDSLFRIFTPDTLAASDTSAHLAEINPFIPPDPSSRIAASIDSIAIDSLRLTVGPDADSVVTSSVITSTLSDPPAYSYWYASPSLSRNEIPILVVDPSFFRLRAKAHVDTASTLNIAGLLPDRVGLRDQPDVTRYPQQVIRAPAGTYRKKYLATWRLLQQDNLKQHYCKIFPFPLQTEWQSTSMH